MTNDERLEDFKEMIRLYQKHYAIEDGQLVGMSSTTIQVHMEFFKFILGTDKPECERCGRYVRLFTIKDGIIFETLI